MHWLLLGLTSTLLGLLWKNIRGRASLCESRWHIYQLAYLHLFQNKTSLEYWEAPDPKMMLAYSEGRLSLSALLRQLEQKYYW